MSRDSLSGHGVRGLSPADHANRRNLNHSLKPDQSRRNESSAIPPSIREQVSFRAFNEELILQLSMVWSLK